MYKLHLIIDGLPRRTNNNASSWRARAAEARVWKRRVVDAVVLKRAAPAAPLAKAKLILRRYSSVEPDSDGLVSSFKHVIDGLIEAKVLKNDKRENIGMPAYDWRYAPRNNGFIEIMVEEVSPEIK